MKDKLQMLIATLLLTALVVILILLIISFNKKYDEYEIQGESFVIVCDEVKMNVNNNNYICTNEYYTYNFSYSTILDLTKEYNIEVYYKKTRYIEWLIWWSNPKERQVRKIVVRSN